MGSFAVWLDAVRVRVFGLPGHGCESDLGGVEELAGVFVLDGSEEHALAGAGDEVTDILIARERGHGQAEGYADAAFGGAQVLRSLPCGCVNPYPGLIAEGDGGVFEGGMEGCFQALGGGRGMAWIMAIPPVAVFL